MKRHTRSSRQGIEDAAHGNLGRAERNTRSRTSSEDLVIHELPKITRNRKSLPAQNVTESPREWVERKTRHSSGGKPRTRIPSGADGMTVTGQSKSQRGISLPNSSDKNDGLSDQNKCLKNTPTPKLSGVHGKVSSKMSLRSKLEKNKNQDDSPPQKTLESTPDVDERISKVTVATTVRMRTRHNSGKSSGLKRSGQNQTFDQTVSGKSPDDNGDDNVLTASSSPILSNSLLSTVETPSGNQHNLNAASGDTNTNSDVQKNEHSISVEISNVRKHDSQDRNMLTGRRVSPRKVAPEIESAKSNSTSSTKVDKSPLNSSNSMHTESKESKQETSKRKLLTQSSDQASQKDHRTTESSEPQRKRHRTFSASRSLQAEFDNLSCQLSESKSELDPGSGNSVSKNDLLELDENVVEKPSEKAENKSDVLVTTVPTPQKPDALVKLTDPSNEMERENAPCASDDSTGSMLGAIDSVPQITQLPLPVNVDHSLQPSKSLIENSSESTGDLQGLTAKLDGHSNKIQERDKVSDNLQLSVSEINNDQTGSGPANIKSKLDVTPPLVAGGASSKGTGTSLTTTKSSDTSLERTGTSLASTSSGYLVDVQDLPASSEEKSSHSETFSPLDKDDSSGSGGKQVPHDVGYEAVEWCQEVDEGEPFFFESDHLALKGNKDYRMLLRTLTTLEAQRKQAAHDLETLVKRQKEAFCDPISFVNKIQHNVDLKLPVAQRVVPLPEVNWEAYLGKPENSELLLTVANQKIKTRPSNSASVIDHHNCICCKKNRNQQCQKSDHHGASTSGGKSGCSQAGTSKTKSEPKSETFNLPWTVEEQKKLEELLVKYPMEAVEARRWEKIAGDLGNRTPLQVASRVQKYFIKLTRAGLPVPGRLPHSVQPAGTKKNRRTHPFMRPVPSTFLQSVVPPVYMNENDSWDSMDGDSFIDEEPSDDESIPPEIQESEEYKELKRLKQLRRDKLRQQSQMTHSGYQCDKCGVEPIVGTRWHCSDCPSTTSTDLCQKCMDSDDFSSYVHTSSHHLEPIRFKMEATYVDNDYTRFQQQMGPYNYLDPNYTPDNQPDL